MKNTNTILLKKSINESTDLMVSGYANVFDIVDFHNDIIIKGAFKESLLKNEKNIKFLWQHDAKIPIGRINKAYEDNYGLYIEAIITSGTEKGKEAIDLVSKQIIRGLSIGFNVVKSYTNEEGKRVVTQLDLWEVSLVTFPANTASEISDNNLNNALKMAENQINLINRRIKNESCYQDC